MAVKKPSVSDEVRKRERYRKIIIAGIFAVPALLVAAAVILNIVLAPPQTGFDRKTQADNSAQSEQPVDPAGTPQASESAVLPKQETETVKNTDQNLLDKRVNVRHILISYRGAEDAPEDIKLSRDEAYSKALEVRERLLEHPGNFAETAKKYSFDTATAKRGGLIPGFRLMDVEGPFRNAILKLKPGEISGVVESAYGFHIIQVEDIDEGIFQSILIPFKGALHASSEVVRTEEEALREAQRIRKEITEKDADFSEMAKKFSRDPWSEHGGFMKGIVQTGSIPHKEIEEEAFKLKPGEISPVFRSPLGYHILKRHPVEGRQGCQIVVLYGGEGRVEEMARRIINEANRDLKEGRPFPDVVKEYSDESYENTHGGFTPVIYRGTWDPVIEDLLFSMKIGHVSKPVKRDYGWVIIARVR